jgi:glycosyltransferase involved in cell wall biosynthesis
MHPRGAARRDRGSVVLEYRDPVPYGRPFLDLLRGYDAALLPSLSDEQPRLLFDAFSQAVPVIGSDTGGLRDLVQPGVTGVLLPAGKASVLADAMIHASASRAELRAMGIASLAKARGQTHRAMCRKRHEILLDALSECSTSEAASQG